MITKVIKVGYQHFVFEQIQKLIEALRFAAEKHKGVRRKDGVTPYLLHVLEVVCIMIDQKVFDFKAIVAAIIHDVVEDTDAKIKEVRHRFGFAIARIVELLTKHPNFILKAGYWFRIKFERDPNIRWRVIVIKFADRIHNLMTLDSVPEDKRKNKVKETLNEFPDLYRTLIKTFLRLRKNEVLTKDAYLQLPFHLNNQLIYQLSRYQ